MSFSALMLPCCVMEARPALTQTHKSFVPCNYIFFPSLEKSQLLQSLSSQSAPIWLRSRKWADGGCRPTGCCHIPCCGAFISLSIINNFINTSAKAPAAHQTCRITSVASTLLFPASIATRIKNLQEQASVDRVKSCCSREKKKRGKS